MGGETELRSLLSCPKLHSKRVRRQGTTNTLSSPVTSYSHWHNSVYNLKIVMQPDRSMCSVLA